MISPFESTHALPMNVKRFGLCGSGIISISLWYTSGVCAEIYK